MGNRVDLGDLCGLMPDTEHPTSDQLHRVLELSSGIREEEEGAPSSPAHAQTEEVEEDEAASEAVEAVLTSGKRSVHRSGKSPAETLREALSSKEAFQKYYLVRSHFLTTFYSIYSLLFTGGSFINICHYF